MDVGLLIECYRWWKASGFQFPPPDPREVFLTDQAYLNDLYWLQNVIEYARFEKESS